MEKTITLIRHGKTLGNLEKRYIGITDEPLSKQGVEEIAAGNYPACDILFSSPLRRCIQTAKIIYPAKEPIVIQELKETNFGRFEGKNYQDLSEDLEYIKWIESGGTAPFPEGEGRSEVIKRTMIGFEKLIGASDEYKSVVAVVHGGTIMSILSSLFKGDYYSYHVENGEGYTFDLSSDGLYHRLRFRSFTR